MSISHIPELLDLVDEKKIALRPAVEMSYLPKERQKEVYTAIGIAVPMPPLRTIPPAKNTHNRNLYITFSSFSV